MAYPALLVETLTPEQRLALAYAPGRARAATLAVLAFDARLASLVRGRKEPMLVQLRLAWWRDRLHEPASARPAGDPLLDLIGQTGLAGEVLAEAVDGWELLLADRLDAEAAQSHASQRGLLFAALAGALGEAAQVEAAAAAGTDWALADLSAHLSDPAEQAAVGALLAERRWHDGHLPRALRSLAVLHGLARRGKGDGLATGPGALLAALRIGMFGR